VSSVRRFVIPLLAAWLGAALLTATVVAPAAFAVLPSRSLAGALVGRVLPVLFISGSLVAAIAFWTSRALRRHAIARVTALVWIASMLFAQFVITPRIQSIRTSVGAIDSIPADDPVRVRFGRLHGVSVLLLGVGMVGALTIMAAGMSRTERKAEG